MSRAILAISGSAVGLLNRPFVALGASIAGYWRDLGRVMFATYHPERHYMRGPGPACAAKHGAAQD